MVNKKVILLIVCVIFNSFLFFGQTIKIKSSDNHQPIPFVRVDINYQSETFHERSDQNGVLQLDAEFIKKPIRLKFSVFDFQTKEIKNFILHNDTVVFMDKEAMELEEVAITAQYREQLIEDAVHDIKIVDRKKIEALSAQNLKEVLSNELNIRLGEDMVLGSTMQLQGLGGQNVKILLDGVPLTGRQDGNIDLSQILTENISRIEIVEGPLSVNYGTDALAGTINIITKKSQQKKIEFISNNYFESSIKVNNTASIGWKVNEHHQFRLEGGRQFFDGWNPSHEPFYYNSKPRPDSTRVQLWNPKEQIFGGLTYRFHKNKTTLDYGSQYFDERIINKGYPRAPYQETAFDDYYHTQRMNHRINLDFQLPKEYKLTILAGYDGYYRKKNTMIRDLTEASEVPSNAVSDHDTSQFHSLMSRGRFVQAGTEKKFNYELGYDIIHEMAVGQKIVNKRQSIGDYALFSTLEYTPVSSLTIRPGLRYSYNTAYNAPLTPSLNIKYNVFDKGKNKLTIRGSYARGFRAPTIKELHYEFVDVNHNIVGNTDLEAEYSNHGNLSLTHIFRTSKISVRTKAGLFLSNIQNLITLAQDPASETKYTYFNLDRYTTSGLQFESFLAYKQWSGAIGAAYIGRDNHLTDKKNNFLFSPEVNFSLQYNWEKIGLQIASFYKYTGALPSIYADASGGFIEGRLQDYHIADLTLSKYIWQKRIKATVGVKNLFNVTSVNSTLTNTGVGGVHSSGSSAIAIGMGRTFNLGIKIHLQTK